uniref:Uncharacterized protein n=1 Tax=Lygus hesperus TaxID=30085 RepID=A0A146LNE6_LYGHE
MALEIVNVTVRGTSDCEDVPNDWMLASFSPIQLEESLMRACFAPNAPYQHKGEVLSVAPPDVRSVSEYIWNFLPVFETIVGLQGENFYLVVLATPVVHLPIYRPFRNLGLSLHLFPGTLYDPKSFRDQLRTALHRFLSSPDAFIVPPKPEPPEDASSPPEGQVPVRMFVIKLADVCCPGRTERLCDNTLQDVKYLYSKLPAFRALPYTASVYLATRRPRGSINLDCLGYQKRVFARLMPAAFREGIIF